MSGPTVTVNGMIFTFRRGFVAEVALPCADWLRYGHALVRAAPLEEVRLSDKSPEPHTPRGGGTNYSWHDIGFSDDGATLPEALYLALRGGTPGLSSGRRAYPARAAALSALSAACLSWAKSAP